MAKILDFIRLLRPQQWYKNLLVFLPIIFVGMLFDINALLLTVLGFISLCLVSSANYILNDILDIQKDRQHPEKRTRPLASGAITIWQASVFFLAVFSLSIYVAAKLPALFLYSVIALFVLTLLYSFWLKREVFADITLIGINFVIRAASGAFIIDVKISPWLIVGVFFFAVFLAAGKRHSEAILLKKALRENRQTLKHYTSELTTALMIVTTALLILAYSLYSFFSEHSYLIYTLPFAFYSIFRYFQLVYSGSKIARHPELVVKDARMITGILLWAALTLCLIYLTG